MSVKPKIKFSLIMVVVTASVFSMSTSMSNSVFAAGNPQNGFGKAASECASSKTCPTDNTGGQGSMGEHSKAGSAFTGQPPFDSDGKNGRNGIGNVAKSLCDSDSVSDLGNFLSGKTSSC